MTANRPFPRAVATLVAVTVAFLAACDGGSSGTTKSSATAEPVPAASPSLDLSDVVELAPQRQEEILPVLAASSRATADDLLTRSGIVDVLPSASQTLARLDAVAAGDAAAATGGAVPEPAGLRRTPPPPAASHGAALGLGTLGVGLSTALERGADGSQISADQTINWGDPVEGTPPVQMKLVDGTVELRILQRVAEPVDGGTMSVEFDLRGELDACPSTDGTVTATLSADVRVEALGGASKAGGRYTIELDVLASVDDTAELTESIVDVSGSVSDTTTTSGDAGTDIEGWFVEGGSRLTIAGRVADGITVTDVADAGFTRWSSDTDGEVAAAFLLQQSSIATALASLVLDRAEAFWRGGSCVDVQLPPAGDPAAVQPGKELPVGIEATSAVDGQPIGAPATAVATATGGTVTPSDTAQQLPADVIYVVPGDGVDGEITAIVTSRRGIGTATLAITTARALVVDGSLDVFHASGTKCGGVVGAWELALSADFQGYPFTGVLRFDISDTGTGAYTLVGSTSGGGITVDQTGSGTVEVAAAPNGQQLIFTGTAWSGGPVQVRSIEATSAPDADC